MKFGSDTDRIMEIGSVNIKELVNSHINPLEWWLHNIKYATYIRSDP